MLEDKSNKIFWTKERLVMTELLIALAITLGIVAAVFVIVLRKLK